MPYFGLKTWDYSFPMSVLKVDYIYIYIFKYNHFYIHKYEIQILFLAMISLSVLFFIELSETC